MKKLIILTLAAVCLMTVCGCSVVSLSEDLQTIGFDLQDVAVMEITVMGKGDFYQSTDSAVISAVTDRLNKIEFSLGKDDAFVGDAFEIKFYSNKAQLIERIVVMSDREILYGKDSVNYIARQDQSIGYDFIKSLLDRDE